jgi:hypothetical protein
MSSGYNIISIDETWLSETDYRRRKWGARYQSNSMRDINISSRVTLVTSLDSNGKVHLCFS